MGAELVQETFHTTTPSLKCMEIECRGADAGRIPVAKTNSKSSNSTKDVFTVLNWELRLEICISLCWALTFQILFIDSFVRMLCFHVCLRPLAHLYSLNEDSGDQDWKGCFIIYSLSQSLFFFSSHTYISSFFPPLPYLWRQYFQMCTFSVSSECSLD